jgi:hypothetical protein
MNAKEFYDYIVTQMTPEQALMKFIKGATMQYENLKFDGEPAHPLMVMAMAAKDMGWSMALDNSDPDAEVQGLVIGTSDYLDKIFPKSVK